jgi:hypothetical protein
MRWILETSPPPAHLYWPIILGRDVKANPSALRVAELTQRLVGAYYALAAAIEVAKDPRVKPLFSDIPPDQIVPVGFVSRKDGTRYPYHFHDYLDQVRTSSEMVTDFQRTWLAGSLLAIGDALKRYGYFDRAPELELIYHLRNGVAHGNTFQLDKKSIDRLHKYPAHNKNTPFRTATTKFEIVEGLRGQRVLFDFMGHADTLDVLSAVGVYLWRMGKGEPRRPEHEAGL